MQTAPVKSPLSVSLGTAGMLAVILTLVFAAYVRAEKKIDLVHEQRYLYRQLADEMRSTSDNLTRLARAYVLTGNDVDKQNYQAILDIRDGKLPRQDEIGAMRWTFEPVATTAVVGTNGKVLSLLEALRNAGLTDEEFGTMSQAKARSDHLATVELAAMRQFESSRAQHNATQARQAADMLHNDSYREAKVEIYRLINDFNLLTAARSHEGVKHAAWQAMVLRAAFVLLAILLLLSLWHSYTLLRAVLGGSFSEVYAQIHRLGLGNFSPSPTMAAARSNSVLGWLYTTMQRLETSAAAGNDSNAHLIRLSQLYETRSECSKAMVYCSTEQALFERVCQTLVECGAMRMAWIGMIDPAGSAVVPAAWFGHGIEYLKDLHISCSEDSISGHGPTGIAIRTDQPFWCQDFANDPSASAWHLIGARCGWEGAASLPLHRDGRVIGCLIVYAAQVDAFDPSVQKLLTDMVADLDYAIKNLDLESARAAAETRTLESETRLMLALKGTQEALWDWDIQNNKAYFSPQWWAMIGHEPEAMTVDTNLWSKVLHPDDADRFKGVLRTLLHDHGDNLTLECRIMHRDGHAVPVLVRGFVVRDEDGRPLRISGTNMDLTERKRAEKLDDLRTFMLEKLNSDLSLELILRAFVLKIESLSPPALCSVLLLDAEGKHLMPGAAPSLPDFFNEALVGLEIGPSRGSCGTAAFTRERVIVDDIATHPLWADFRELAQRANLASCWSEPVISGNGKVLGTFAIYHRHPQAPDSQQIKAIEMAAHFTAIAIERKQAETQLQLVARVFEQGGEVIVITDSRSRIIRVNNAFTRVTGYTEAEALGRNPNMLSSGKQDAAFYRGMWDAINARGQWHGEMWNRRKDGSVYPEWLSISVLRDANGAVTNYVALATDISKRKQDEEHIRQLADFDPLTQLPNRRLLQDRVENALGRAQRHQTSVALMFLDLDRFKHVNDSLGHHRGDELLVQVAKRLKTVLREQDTVCRLGGDEFVLLLPDTDAAGAANVATKLIASASERYLIDHQELSITFSIGIALYPTDGQDFSTLSMSADTAMYRAKQGGRNAFCFFTSEMQAESIRVLNLENGLRRALEDKQLFLMYQPQISMQTGRVIGVEALIRWQHPTLGRISPVDFIPIAEESGLILPIGEWVLRTACQQLRAWRDSGLALDLVAVNVSAVQFRHVNLPDLVAQVLADTGLPARHLEMELTEGVAMENPLAAIETMRKLDAQGVRLSLDDFGTGYSSLNYLKRFQVYKLKIDKSFVQDVTHDPDDRAIVTAIIGLAQSLGFTTIAEGVETLGQLAFLREHGCDEVQGYLHSPPLPVDELEAYVRGINAP